MLNSYTIRFVPNARKDLVQMKTYILNEFKYPQYGVNFDKKIREALMIIKKSPTSFKNTQLIYMGLNIYMNNVKSYLFFYVVDDTNIWILRVLKERMNWVNILKIWIKQNG